MFCIFLNSYLQHLKQTHKNSSKKSLKLLNFFKKTVFFSNYLYFFCEKLKVKPHFFLELCSFYFGGLKLIQQVAIISCYFYGFLLPSIFYFFIFSVITWRFTDNKQLLILVLQNTQKQLFCFMHAMWLLIHKIFSTGMFLKIINKKTKSLKRKDSIQLLFLKFFLNFFKVKQLNKKLILILNKYNAFAFSKLMFTNIFLKKNVTFILIRPMLKFGLLKLKRVKAIKKVLKKKLLKQFT